MRRVQKAAAVLAALALTTALAVPVWADDITNKKTITSMTDSENKAEIDVKGQYVREKVYRVDIAWDDMSDFVYTAGKWNVTDDTNPKMQYDKENTEVGWNNTVADNDKTATHKIKVTNYSNANIAMQFEYSNEYAVYDTEVKTYPVGEDTTGDGVSRKMVSGFFVQNDAADIKTNTTGNIIKADEKIWLQRADAIVRGTYVKKGTKKDDAGYNALGSPVTGEIGFMMAGRPIWNMETAIKIGTITVTISDAGDEESLAAPDSGYKVTYTHTKDTEFEALNANAGD